MAEMSVTKYIVTEPDPVLEFRFTNSYTKFKNSRKIIVQQSRIYEYMYKMDHGKVFEDPARHKEVHFKKRGNNIILENIVNGIPYPYTLHPEEREQIDDWLDQNMPHAVYMTKRPDL